MAASGAWLQYVTVGHNNLLAQTMCGEQALQVGADILNDQFI